jgi:hypothetical protein
VGAEAPPAVFAGVSVATFLVPLVAAGARVVLGGEPPFIYGKGWYVIGYTACVLTSVVGFLVAAVGFPGVFLAIAISESECEGGKKKRQCTIAKPCVIWRDGSSEVGTWTAEPRRRLTNLYTSRRQKAVPNE